MVSVDKEFEKRGSKLEMDVNEKVKLRKFLKELKKNDRKASVWAFLHIFAELAFFWSIITMAVAVSGDFLLARLPGSAAWYINGMVWFFELFLEPTSMIMPYAFVCMMMFGVFRGTAERARTTTVTSIISLLTFAEQRDLLSQMRDYVDTKVESVKQQTPGQYQRY